MSTEVIVALIGAAAASLGIVLVVAVVIANWKAIGRLPDRTTKVSMSGVVLEFAARELQDSKDRPVSAVVSERLRSRADRLRDRVTGMRVLRVDDKPLGNSADGHFSALRGRWW